MAPMGFRIKTNPKVVITNSKVVITILLLKFCFLLMAPIELRTFTLNFTETFTL